MNKRGWWIRLGVWGCAFTVMSLTLPSGPLSAQGVTTSALSGRVLGPSGQPVAAAQVAVTNSGSGIQSGALAGNDGRYFVPFLEPGGPYTIEVSSIGFETRRIEGVQLSLGQTLRLDVTLSEQAIQLEGLTISVDEVFNPERTGQETKVSDEQLAALPTLSRNFTELASLSPLVSSGVGASVGGQNNRFNNVQIDGAVNNDVFGLADSGVPGGQANAKPISQDAIAEFQVLVAPFDVRQSGFTGGLINAITKSGTNEFHGSLSGYFRNLSLLREDLVVRGDTFGFSDFEEGIVSFTLGGPIKRDRVHFFVAGEVERFNTPVFAGAESAANILGLDPTSITRVEQVAQGYGLEFGRISAYDLQNPKRNLFGRLDFQLSPAHRHSLKQKYDAADSDDGPSRSRGTFEPESATYDFNTSTHTSVAQLFSQLGTWSNEVLATVQFVRDSRAPAEAFRYATVNVDVPDDPFSDGAEIGFGAERFSHANRLDQDIFQLTNNLTGSFGAHRITLGATLERYAFSNLFADRSLGQYDFDSVEDFQNGTASFYALRVPHSSITGGIDATAAEFSYMKYGAYAQDEFQASDRLSLTAGLRIDVPVTGDVPRDNTDFSSRFGFATTEVPSGNLLVQPRLGFNYQLDEDGSTQLRGGAGIFAGRPPFVWVANGFGNTGRESVELRCFGGNVPAFNPTAPPMSCLDGSGPASARASIAVLDPDFKFPQELKLDLGLDRRFGDGWRATFEGIYTKSLDAIVVEELNSSTPQGRTAASDGVGDRVVYGTRIDSDDDPWSPVFVNDSLFLEVVRLTNSSEGYSYSLVSELEKRFSDRFDARAAYTFGRSYDIMSLTSSRAVSNWGFNVIGESVALADRPLTPSTFDRPHRVIASVTGRFLPDYGGTAVSLLYRGQSGQVYSYVYDGDVNGDGFANDQVSNSRTNDLVYVPNASTEMAFQSPDDERLFNEIVNLEPCLADARGSIMERNSCRGPWNGQLDLRLSQGLNLPQGRVEVLVDVFNFLNLMNGDWGIQEGPAFSEVQLLRTRGRANDDPNGPILFSYDGARRTVGDTQQAQLPYNVFSTASRWQMRLGLRYVF